ncbi:16S rRNA (guanine(966)-N(2))-methyltransferase RsmD [Cellvibrio mixtus]|uniref:16S rRNA (guanine(966)-N(2))-methyltransferase RsmD n=1 Tax=Cellvibrio mixtus TaxID=39650 RepID=UPI000587B389|nr:16S rRNA (guanine(966)-N(2))-methyltransferase RsmD [Cellvibrio mixtus]
MSRHGAKPAKSPANPPKGSNQLRIIGGTWRGRKLNFPDVDGLRPTGDRLRETLFNWLAPDIQDARCLDLFAGSGALGLEALSRGAAGCVFLERDPLAAKELEKNLRLLNATTGKLLLQDALSWLKGIQGQQFDLVFIDPPFQLALWQHSFDLLEDGNFLAEGALVYVECPKNTIYQVPESWSIHKEKITGSNIYRLFVKG